VLFQQHNPLKSNLLVVFAKGLMELKIRFSGAAGDPAVGHFAAASCSVGSLRPSCSPETDFLEWQ
jgi:hypothetical protein